MKKRIIIFLITTLVFMINAQEIPDFYGFISIYKTSIFKDMDDDLTFIPIPPGVGRIMTMIARPIQINISENDYFLVRTHLEYFRAPYEPGDFPLSSGMQKRDGSLMTGLSIKSKKKPVILNVAADVLSKSEGTKLELFYNHSLKKKRNISEDFRFGIKIFDKDFTDYYYGVKAGEAKVNRPFYRADSSINPSISYNVRKMITSKRTFLYAIEADFYDKEIKESPLVQDSYTLRFSFGILWSR